MKENVIIFVDTETIDEADLIDSESDEPTDEGI